MRQSYIDEKVDIACPDLLSYEVLNALRYNPEFGQEQTRIAAEALEKYQLLLHPMQAELGALSIKNSFAYGISLYDSSYVSLAELLEAEFYTADQKMLDKLGEKERFKHISRFNSS
jgi:predicted nucleic acid-binding protein